MSDYPTEPNDEFSDDALDALLRQADPGRQPISVESTRSHWVTLAASQRRRRRQFAIAGFATAACLLLTFGIKRQFDAMNSMEQDRIATSDPLPRIPSKAVVTPSPDAIASSDPEPTVQVAQPDGQSDGPEGMIEATDTAPQVASETVTPTKITLVDRLVQTLKTLPETDRLARVQFVHQVRQLTPPQQRDLVKGIPLIENDAVRRQAMAVIIEAAGSDAFDVQIAWLAFDSTREDSWVALVHQSDVARSARLLPYAKTDRQKRLLCQKWVAQWNVGGLKPLIDLATVSSWRVAVQAESANLDAQACLALIRGVDAGDLQQRVASAFVLAAMRQPEVDSMLIQSIIQGRNQLPAFQGLIARDTTAARQFLALSVTRYDLSPAFAAARRRSLKWGPQAFQWVTETRSRNHVQDSILFDDSFNNMRIVAATFPSAARG